MSACGFFPAIVSEMRSLKTSHLAVIAALGAAFAFLTTKTRAETPQNAISYVDPRIAAFLDMIGVLETGSAGGYDIFYGGSRFFNYDDHPVLTGEKSGVALSPATCRAAGFAGGVCESTAAGKYQFIAPTWREIRSEYPPLPDFSAASQDEAAIRLLQKIGALDALLANDFDTALQLASKRWASLPGSQAKQNPKSYAYALTQYLHYLDA